MYRLDILLYPSLRYFSIKLLFIKSLICWNVDIMASHSGKLKVFDEFWRDA